MRAYVFCLAMILGSAAMAETSNEVTGSDAFRFYQNLGSEYSANLRSEQVRVPEVSPEQQEWIRLHTGMGLFSEIWNGTSPAHLMAQVGMGCFETFYGLNSGEGGLVQKVLFRRFAGLATQPPAAPLVTVAAVAPESLTPVQCAPAAEVSSGLNCTVKQSGKSDAKSITWSLARTAKLAGAGIGTVTTFALGTLSYIAFAVYLEPTQGFFALNLDELSLLIGSVSGAGALGSATATYFLARSALAPDADLSCKADIADRAVRP